MNNLQRIAQEFNAVNKVLAPLAKTLKTPGFISHDKPLIHPEDMFEETDTPNVLLDRKAYPVFDGDKVVDRFKKIITTGAQTEVNNTTTLVYGDTSMFTVGDGIVLIDETFNKEVLRSTIVNISDNSYLQFKDTYNRKEVSYSVIVLPKIALPEAPMSGIDDELLDDSVNGLICQQSHNEGDIVVTGNELSLIVPSSSGTSSAVYVNDASLLNLGEQIVAIKTSTNEVIVNDTITEINTSANPNYIRTSTVYNREVTEYSVRRRNKVYQAERGTDKMYDYTTDDGVVPYYDNMILKIGSNHHSLLTEGDYWKYIGGGTGSNNYSNFPLTDYPASWVNIGTVDNMSLQNPYFKSLDNKVLRKDYVLWNKTTQAYESFKGTQYFDKADVTVEEFISKYTKYSQVDGYLISDGVNEYIYIGVLERLNAGATHPVYNEFGTNRVRHINNIDSRLWYEENAKKIVSVYQSFQSSFNGASDTQYGTITSGFSGKPDGKFYDKIYINQCNINFLPKANRGSKLEEREYLDKYYANGGDVCSFGSEIVYGISISTGVSNGGFIFFEGVSSAFIPKGAIVHSKNKGYGTIGGLTLEDIQIGYDFSNGIKLDRATPERTNDEYIINGLGISSSYGSSLHTDIVGTNYPSDWLSHLSSGNSISNANALLVGPNGEDYIPDGSFRFNDFTLSLKNLNYYQMVSTGNQGLNYSTYLPNLDAILNKATDDLSMNTGVIRLLNYESKNTLPTSTPQQVEYTSDKVKASNSHSLYKGSNIANSITGGVNTGSSANGYESKVLENVEMPKADIIRAQGGSWSGFNNNKWFGTIIHHDVVGGEASGADLGFYVYQGDFAGTIEDILNTNLTLTEANDWYSIGTTPKHSTLTPNSVDRKCAKWFSGISEKDYQIFGQEIRTLKNVYPDGIGFDTFTEIDEYTDLSGVPNHFYVRDGRFAGHWRMILRPQMGIPLVDFMYFEVDNMIYFQTVNSTPVAVRYNGETNITLDSGEFRNLTNGYDTYLGEELKTTVLGVSLR